MNLLKICSGAAVAGAMVFSGLEGVAMAAPVTAPSANVERLATLGWSPSDDITERYRWRHRRHRGIDGGDILAGALIIGGIAAIASAASNNAYERRYPRDNRYYRNAPYRDDRRNYDNRYQSNELNQVADQCAFAAEERAGGGARVDRITSVARDGAGWRVEGSVSFDGGFDDFMCGVTDGRIDYIQLGR